MTANEIHVPVGRQVAIGVDSDNVIHSFWMPQLAGKLDRYAHLATDRLAFQVPILFCFLTPRREQSARRALAPIPVLRCCRSPPPRSTQR